MNLTEQQLIDNYQRLRDMVNDTFEGDRLEKLNKMYDFFEERIIVAPASGKPNYHYAFAGGYVLHVLHLVDTAKKLMKVYESIGAVIDFTEDELIFCGLHHDLGKVGDTEHEYYLVQEDDWRRKKLNEWFTQNPEMQFMSVTDRALYLLQHFDDFFKYEYTGEMEQKLDEISNGVGMWQDICKECNEDLKEKLKFVKQEKKNGAIKIDKYHTYMVSKWGPVVRCEIDGKITYKKVKKNLDIDQMDRENLVLKEFLEQEEDNVLGMLEDKPVVIKEGKYGIYVNWNDKNYSVKNINKNKEDVVLEDVVDILLGKKSSNPNVLRIINKNISIRKGKYGAYVFYKTERMDKPKFIQLRKVFENQDNKKWQDYGNEDLEELIENVL